MEKLDFTNMTVREAVEHAVRIIHYVHETGEGKEKEFETELGWVCDESNKQFARVPKDLHDAATAKAKEYLDQQDLAA